MADEPIRVLLVEDNPADARLIRESLAEPGAGELQVTCAERLAEAIQRLRDEPFNVVLLDLTLPDSQSIDTVCRAYAEASQVPIVVLTGMEDEALGVEAVRQGAQDYLVKGQADRRLLGRSIRYAMERHRAERALALYRDGLEKLVASRTAALRETNEALQDEIRGRARAEEALASARRKLQTDREQQRLHLAGELHDSLGQELIGLKFSLEQVLARGKDSLGTETTRLLAAAIEKCVSLIREVRAICHGLYPPGLESFGLVSALKQLTGAGLTPVPVVLNAPESLAAARFPTEVEIALFRIAQEAVQNALKHSRARHIGLHLTCEDGQLRLTVVDDGVGFNPDQAMGRGLGLISMRDRVQTGGGLFRITSSPGETRVEAAFPVEQPKPASRPCSGPAAGSQV